MANIVSDSDSVSGFRSDSVWQSDANQAASGSQLHTAASYCGYRVRWCSNRIEKHRLTVPLARRSDAASGASLSYPQKNRRRVTRGFF